ncbi:MAG TPA: hypothetical protein VNR87_01675 [Flavisolibacter sp.]|nr:hypothetical protein [Flavisolibacter sp.]
MDQVKRLLGIVWIIIGIASIFALMYAAATNINSAKGDIGKPIPWIIIIIVFTPISVGLIIFGWYALKGSYDGEIRT